MPQSRKKAAVVEPEVPVEPVAEVATNGVHEPEVVRVRGFRLPPRWVRKTLKATVESDDSDALWIECNVAGISTRDLLWLNGNNGITWGDVWAYMAPRIRAWNIVAFDHETKQEIIAPAPAEIGTEAFAIVDNDLASLCRLLLTNACVEGGDDFLSA